MPDISHHYSCIVVESIQPAHSTLSPHSAFLWFSFSMNLVLTFACFLPRSHTNLAFLFFFYIFPFSVSHLFVSRLLLLLSTPRIGCGPRPTHLPLFSPSASTHATSVVRFSRLPDPHLLLHTSHLFSFLFFRSSPKQAPPQQRSPRNHCTHHPSSKYPCLYQPIFAITVRICHGDDDDFALFRHIFLPPSCTKQHS